MNQRLLVLTIALAFVPASTFLAQASTSPAIEKEEVWRPWADLLGVPALDLPAAVASLRGVPLASSRCAGPAPTLDQAIAHLGEALDRPDARDPAVVLSSGDAAVLARVVDCMALHAEVLPAYDHTAGVAPQELQTAWLSALRDVLAVLPTAPLTGLPSAGCIDLLCLVILGGCGDNTYTADSALIIDPCGNDTYRNNAGGANPLRLTPIAVLVDQGAGIDSYLPIQTDLYGYPTLGSGYDGGVGILVDEGGSDHYRGLGGTMGTAFSGGGYLLDRGGNDFYESPYPSPPGSNPGQSNKVVIGAAAYGGYGFLIDESGSDVYVQHGVDSLGWGGAGSVGLLLDLVGADDYVVNPAPTGDVLGGGGHTVSGVSIGTGEVGGVGVVLDGAGNDEYACTGLLGYGCIGSSYFGGQMGLVYDRGGNDRYSLPVKEEDDYYSPGGMGSGGLDGLGILVDEAGDDAYTSAAVQSGGYGSAGGEGLFLDRGSSLLDTYSFARPPWVGVRANNQQWVGDSGWGALSAAGVGIDR